MKLTDITQYLVTYDEDRGDLTAEYETITVLVTYDWNLALEQGMRLLKTRVIRPRIRLWPGEEYWSLHKSPQKFVWHGHDDRLTLFAPWSESERRERLTIVAEKMMEGLTS